MWLKWLFDRVVSLIGLCVLWPVFILIAVLIKVKMPGPVLFVQKRVGKNGILFDCHKFRSMTIDHNGSSISVAGENRITPLGSVLRKYKLDELPELWDVFIGNMSFVGPRPDVPGYADKLTGENREVLSLRPGVTGPATMKYRNEEEMLASLQPDNGMDIEDYIKWYNDNVIYPDKVRINRYYLNHYSFITDIKMIIYTVLGKKMEYAGEYI